MLRIARALIVTALVISIGLHWAVLQSAAWMSMAVAYTVRTGSVVEGLSDTFDGEHPCPMCSAIKKATEAPPSDRQAPTQAAKELKLTLGLVRVPAFIFASFPTAAWSMISMTADSRRDPPQAPPPRVA